MAEDMDDGFDWDGVARTIRIEMTKLGWNEGKLAKEAGLAKSTVREMLRNTAQRNRSGETLQRLSTALGLHRQHLAFVLVGEEPPNLGETVDQDRLASMEHQLLDIVERLGLLDAKVSALVDGGWPHCGSSNDEK